MQSALTGYVSGSPVSTGLLSTGVYVYALTSVTDASGCVATNLGTPITIIVIENSNINYVPVDSLFRTEIPAGISNDAVLYELGSEFQTLANGFITKARLYSSINEGGVHIIRLWVLNGSSYSLVTGPHIWNFSNGFAGWREYLFSTPIEVEANKTYIISITNGPDMNYAMTFDYGPTTVGSHVRYLRGTYTSNLGEVPTEEWLSCYFRDIVFAVPQATENLTSGTIGTSQTICYNTTPSPLTEFTAPTGGTGTYTYQWQSSSDNTTWTNIAGATLAGYTPPALTVNTYYRRTVTSGNYTPVQSNSVLITVSPLITLAQLHDNITISNNASTDFNVTISGGISPYTINYTRNGVVQSAINNYVSSTNISTGVLTTGEYIYALTSVADVNGCEAQSLGIPITVTVSENGNLAAGSIGTAQTICYNTSPAPLSEQTVPIGGTGEYTYQWQSSPDNSSWTNIVGATLPGYSPGALSSSTYFRRTVSSGGYIPVHSNSVLITVSPQVTLAQLHDNITIGSNTSASFNIVISGGISPYTVIYSLNGVTQSMINNYISGTNVSTGVLSTGIYTYTLTSVMDANGCEVQNLGSDIIITVTAIIPETTIFSTEVPTLFGSDFRYELGTEFEILTNGFITKVRLYSHASENGDHIIRLWRHNGTGYSLIAGPYTWNLPTGVQGWRVYELPAPIAVEANIKYIVSITNGPNLWYVQSENYFSPASTNTNVRYINGLYTNRLGTVPDFDWYGSCYFRDIVFVRFDPGLVGTSQTICYNTTPSPLTEFTAPTGGTGTYTYQWQSSSDNTTWTNIAGATLAGYTPPALTANTYYRRTVTSGNYTPVQSNSVLITVSPLITLAQLHDNITISNNASTDFNVTISGGISPYTINYTRNGVVQSTINNYVSSTNISTGVLTTGEYIYALTSVADVNGCEAQSLGIPITVTVSENGNLAAGSIGTAQTICYNTSPAPLSEQTVPIGGTGEYTYQWQSSPDNSSWTNIVGATLPGYSPGALSSSTYFRRTVSSGSYIPVNSNYVLITVSPQVTLAQLHDNITIGSNTSASFNIVISGGISPYTITYTRNGVTQSTINSYISGTNVSTGVLTTGIYTYTLTSVMDANGCEALSHGTNITITVTELPPIDELRVYPNAIVFNAVQNQTLTDTRSLFIFTAHGNTIYWAQSTDVSWLTPNLHIGETEAVLSVGVNTNGLTSGLHYGNIILESSQSSTGPIMIPVTLIINPDVPVKVTTWKDGKDAAMSVSVDDGNSSGFDVLQTNGFYGTYVCNGTSPPSFYSGYFNAGMELGSHLVNHPCYLVSDDILRIEEIEPNILGICTNTPQPCQDLITLVWPCGTTNYREQAVASKYFLGARGYYINQLEDATPENFMNLKSFNSNGDPWQLPPADFITLVDIAIAQKKWFNLVLHTQTNDDGAINYANTPDISPKIWVAPIGTVVKYILQRDRLVLTNYNTGVDFVRFGASRLSIPPSSYRSFETGFGVNDSTTIQIDIDNNRIIENVLVDNIENHYKIKNLNGNLILLINLRLVPSITKNVEVKYYNESLAFVNSLKSEGDSNLLQSTTQKSLDGLSQLDNRFHQNYPNPFLAYTWFEFDLTEDSHVILELYNSLGQKIETILNQVMKSGNNKVIWYSRNYQSGIYYVTLKAGIFKSTIKISLLN